MRSDALIENTREYDGKEIIYEGEAIGDLMPRGDFAWINLHDGQNAIGVWVKRDEIEGTLEYRGGYLVRGDRLSVKGIFHRACKDHGGELDIHAISVAQIVRGERFEEKVREGKKELSRVLSYVAGLVAILYFFSWWRAKKKKSKFEEETTYEAPLPEGPR